MATQIQHDTSYVQVRPVSMVSPRLKPVSPYLESSLCDRRQQVIQQRAKAFMTDNDKHLPQSQPQPQQPTNRQNTNLANDFQLTRNYINNSNNYYPGVPNSAYAFDGGFTSAVAIVEKPAVPIRPPTTFFSRSDNSFTTNANNNSNEPLTLTIMDSYANNKFPAYINQDNYDRLPRSSFQHGFDEVGGGSMGVQLKGYGLPINNFDPLLSFQGNFSSSSGVEVFDNDIDMDNENDVGVQTNHTSSSMLKRSPKVTNSNYGVRAKIARRKMMRKVNSGDSSGVGITDPESSEVYDDDDSVEEKQDSESMNDSFSQKTVGSSPSLNSSESSYSEPKPYNLQRANATQQQNNDYSSTQSGSDWTPETARRSWTSRFSNIKHSFNAASEEDLQGYPNSRSPSMYRQPSTDPDLDRSRSLIKSPNHIERPQSKEDKNKLNAAMTAFNTPKRALSEHNTQSKSKQPTPVREPVNISSGRLSKSVPRESAGDNHRAEVLGFVKSGETSVAGGSKSNDMDYQEYMNIINKVRKSKEIERVRTEQLRLASMYAREKKRQEELKKEDERLQRERRKIEAEKTENPNKNFPFASNSNNGNSTNYNSVPQPTNLVTSHNEIEKGQIEAEFKKLSPARRPLVDEVHHETPQSVPELGQENLPVEDKLQLVAETKSNQEREEQLRMEQIWLEQRQHQVKVEQENLERLREEQLRQEKEREEIRRLEVERLRQIQEEQRRLEEERRRQEEQMRMEQLRLEEERRRHEKLQAERNAEYNRQRLDIEAKNIAALQEEQRAARERQRQQEQLQQQHYSMPGERILTDKMFQQDKLREEHKKEEAKIRQEKLNLINQEEMLIKRQEEMLRQIEAERENLARQEQLIRSRQQDRLKQVRQEKLLLEKQEETLLMREQQLIQEKIRQENLREEQRALREQEEAIRRRQEEISKELMGDLTSSSGEITVCQALEGQVYPGPSGVKSMFKLRVGQVGCHSDSPQKDLLGVEGLVVSSKASTSPPPLQYIPADNSILSNDDQLGGEDGEEFCYSGSESDEDTLDEDGYYESKVEVKQNSTSVPTSVRTIETKIDNPPWAPVTPYLQQIPHAQEEISAIFSHCKSSQFTKAGVVTSPESMRTSTNLITTPESSISMHSLISHNDPRSRPSSYSPPPLPPLPTDEIQTDLFLPVKPDVPPRDHSFAVYSANSENPPVIAVSEATAAKRDLLDVSTTYTNSVSQLSPRLGGPGSAFKPYASSENLFDPNTTRSVQDLPPMPPTQNYPLRNGELGDSRHKVYNGSRDDFRGGPIHGKVRELRRQPVKAPFSTTDTEPEMRECNLSLLDTKKKGKKQIVYSTSETEEEYQAYLRSKPKWHGKGGHKDSWDPLLIQSPPQITQKPVGVIPKPYAALAIAPAFEMDTEIDQQAKLEIEKSQSQELRTKGNETRMYGNNTSSISTPEVVSQTERLGHPTTNYQPQKTDNMQLLKTGPLPITEAYISHSANHIAQGLPEQPQAEPVSQLKLPQLPILGHDSAKPEQTLPQSIAELNRKSIIETPDGGNLHTAIQKPGDPHPQSLSSLMKQSLVSTNLQSGLSQSIRPPPFMSQNGDGPRYHSSPMLNKVAKVPSSHFVPEFMDKERSPNVFISRDKSLSDVSDRDTNGPQGGFVLSRISSIEKSPSATSSVSSQDHGSESLSGLKLTPQRELQQKLMTEALQKIGGKKDILKKAFPNSNRINPTIAAMEIMTRKELKQGEMEQRLARGEVIQIPIPATPPHLKPVVSNDQKAKNSTDGSNFLSLIKKESILANNQSNARKSLDLDQLDKNKQPIPPVQQPQQRQQEQNLHQPQQRQHEQNLHQPQQRLQDQHVHQQQPQPRLHDQQVHQSQTQQRQVVNLQNPPQQPLPKKPVVEPQLSQDHQRQIVDPRQQWETSEHQTQIQQRQVAEQKRQSVEYQHLQSKIQEQHHQLQSQQRQTTETGTRVATKSNAQENAKPINTNIQQQTPIILLKKEPKRLDPEEIRQRVREVEDGSKNSNQIQRVQQGPSVSKINAENPGLSKKLSNADKVRIFLNTP